MKVYVVQYEDGGIPHDPFVYASKDKAIELFVAGVVEQGFRKMHSDENFELYYSDYFCWIEADDTWRYWEEEVIE